MQYIKSRDCMRFGALPIALGALAVVGTASPAFAQSVPAPPSGTDASMKGSSDKDGDIVVTGSRIARSGFTTQTPVTVLGGDQLQKSGVMNIGQIVTEVPQFQASATPQTSTLASQNAGAAFLNLRNLGTTRTLVLVNSRRFVSTTTNSTVDTNVIPSSIIERVDVVTGGASAAYGSDAVAGVVNIILKRNLSGFVGDAQYGMTTYGDNKTYKGSLAWGSGFAGGAGHITIAVEGEANKGLGFQSSRPWARNGYGIITFNGVQTIRPDFQLATATLGGLITSGPLRGTDFGPGGQPRPFVYGQAVGNFQFGGSGLQPSDYLELSVPYDRYTIYGTGEYDFSGVRLSVEGSHSYSIGRSDIVPIFNLGNLTIQPDNPYIPASIAPQVTAPFSFGRYSVDMGQIRATNRNRTDRFVIGLDGSLGGSWKWNIYGEYGHTDYKGLTTNDPIAARYLKSVDAVRSGGNIVCRVNANASTADDDPACVPVNLFGEGSPSRQAIDYFTGTGVYRVGIDQRVVAGSVTGTLFQIDGRNVSLATGAEYRFEKVSGTADATSQANGFLIGNPKRLAGKYDIKEAFGEILVPLLANSLIAKLFEVNGAVRVTDYSTSGTVVTWKGGFSWQVNDDIRFRGTRSRDIRAPNFDELFTDTLFRFTNVADPTRNNTISTVNIITQGNPNLKPETADTLTGGVIFSPTFIPGFRVSVDYFHIKLAGAIGQVGAQDTVNRCFNGNQALCGLITRNSAGAITSVTSTQINLSKIKTSGLDFELAYRVPLAGNATSLDFRAVATYVDQFTTDDGITAIDRAGNVGTTGLPHWKFNASATYNGGPLTLYLQGRYVGGGVYDVTIPPGGISDNRVSGRMYLNASAQYSIVDTGSSQLQLFVNVKNLLNTDPPISPTSFQAPQATNATLYDVVGRMITGGVRFKF